LLNPQEQNNGKRKFEALKNFSKSQRRVIYGQRSGPDHKEKEYYKQKKEKTFQKPVEKRHRKKD